MNELLLTKFKNMLKIVVMPWLRH